MPKIVFRQNASRAQKVKIIVAALKQKWKVQDSENAVTLINKPHAKHPHTKSASKLLR